MVGAGGMASAYVRNFFPQFAERAQIVALAEIRRDTLDAAGDFLGPACERALHRPTGGVPGGGGRFLHGRDPARGPRLASRGERGLDFSEKADPPIRGERRVVDRGRDHDRAEICLHHPERLL